MKRTIAILSAIFSCVLAFAQIGVTGVVMDEVLEVLERMR